MLCLWNYVVQSSFTPSKHIRCKTWGQPCSTGEAELPFTTAVNLTNWTSWAYEETMPQVLGLFEDSSVYPDIWRNASQGWGEGMERKGSRVIPLSSFLPWHSRLAISWRLKNTWWKMRLGIFAAGCDFPQCFSWKAWGPAMQASACAVGAKGATCIYVNIAYLLGCLVSHAVG